MSDKYQDIYRGQTFRLQNWDYGSEGLYYITICTQNREHFFGEIEPFSATNHENGKMILSEIGKIVQSEWLKTPSIRPDMNLELFEFVVMPNHFHAVIGIGANSFNNLKNDNLIGENITVLNMTYGNCRDAMHGVPTISPSKTISQFETISSSKTKKTKNKFGPQSKNLASIVRGFKSSVTTWCRKNNYPNFNWQPLFHDHIIRDQQSFENIQKYIFENPKKWKQDRFRQ
jgi:REP element-mobilizing transposase RayT